MDIASMTKVIPVIKCSDMKESLRFYSEILDFEIKYEEDTADSPVVDIIRDTAELQLSILSGDGVFGSAVNVRVDDVDKLFMKFLRRGLDISGRDESPVHQGPVDQTWGMREFYVTDPDGNTLRFGEPIG